MKTTIRIKQRGATPEITKSKLRLITKGAFEAAGTYWHKTIRPKHFTHRGAKEYGYQPRKGENLPHGSKAFRRSYTGRKLRAKGHTLPLVYSGEGQRLTRLRDVRATSKRVRVVLRANKFNFKPRGGRINMREELTRVSAGDATAMVRVHDRYMDRRLKTLTDTKTTVVK